MNRIKNACFELSRYLPGAKRNELFYWERTDGKRAETISGYGGIMTNYNLRDTYISNGVKLSGRDDDGIIQTVTGLEPNTKYIAAAWLKVGDAQEVQLGIRGYGGKEVFSVVHESIWTHSTVDFTTGSENTSAILFIEKKGNGTAFVDNVGLVPDFGWVRE